MCCATLCHLPLCTVSNTLAMILTISIKYRLNRDCQNGNQKLIGNLHCRVSKMLCAHFLLAICFFFQSVFFLLFTKFYSNVEMAQHSCMDHIIFILCNFCTYNNVMGLATKSEHTHIDNHRFTLLSSFKFTIPVAHTMQYEYRLSAIDGK